MPSKRPLKTSTPAIEMKKGERILSLKSGDLFIERKTNTETKGRGDMQIFVKLLNGKNKNL